MNLEQKLQVMQAAATVFAAQKAGRAAMAAAGRTPAIQPPSDDDLMQSCVDLVLQTLSNKELWPKPGEARFQAMNF